MVAGLRPRRRSLRLAGGRYTQGMSSSEARGFQKLARLRPEELRSLFTSSGRFHGGLRGALLGSAAGYLTADEDDPDAFLTHTLGGALAGGGLGAAIGHLHGAHLAKNPFKRVTMDDGTVMHYLRTPGQFGDELMHAKYPKPRPSWDPVKGTYSLSSEYVPSTGSALLESLMKSRDVPRRFR